MKSQNGFTIVEAFVLGGYGLILLGVIGWIINIVKIFGLEMCFCPMPIMRIIGIFVAPLGAVLGFIPN